MRNQLAQINHTRLVQPNSLGPSIAVAVLELQIHLAGTQSHERNLHLVLADADDEDFAAELDGLDGGADGGFHAGAFHGVAGLDAVGEFEDGGLEIRGRVAEFDFVGEDARNEGFGEVETALVDVGDYEGSRASRLTAEKCDEADRAGAADDGGVTQADVRAVHASKRNGKRLQHGTVFEGHAVGQLVAPHGWVLEVAAEQAGDGWCGQKLNALASVVAACEAWLAFAADDVGFDGYAVAGLEVRDGFVAGHDCAGGFVAEDVGIFYDHGSDAALEMELALVRSLCSFGSFLLPSKPQGHGKRTACQKWISLQQIPVLLTLIRTSPGFKSPPLCTTSRLGSASATQRSCAGLV